MPPSITEMLKQAALPMEDGSWVTQEMVRTAEAIHQQFPDIEVMWIPRHSREDGDPVFALIDRKTREPVIYVRTEEEFNQSLLQRLYYADSMKHTYEDTMKRLQKERNTNAD